MKNKHEINVTIEGSEWISALNKSFDKNVAKTKVDGFRAGKCPRDVYEKKFGKESLYMDAVDFVVSIAYKKAIEESKLIPILQPVVDIKNVDEKSVEFIFTIITKPAVKIKKYKGLKVEKPVIKVTDEEIKQEIESLRKQYAEIVIKDGSIELGDTAVIDFEGFKDGIPFEGGKGENYPLEIGSKTFIPGFEEQLVGLKTNDTKDVKISFPDEYPSEDLKGKEVIFKITVHEVKTKKVPELNEDFFLDLGMDDVKTEKELVKKLTSDITLRKESESENIYIDKLLEAVSANVEVELPDELVNSEVSRMLEQYEEKLKMQGISLDQYLEFTKSNRETLSEQLKGEATKNVLYRTTIEEVAKLEQIVVLDDEIEAEAVRLAASYQMEKEELIKAFGGTDMIRYDLEMRKTIEFLKNNN